MESVSIAGDAPGVPKKKRRINITSLAVVISIVLAWELTARMGAFPPMILPAASSVWQSIVDGAASGDLFRAIGWSLYRVLCGFAVGTGLAIPLGLMIGWSKRAEELINPIIEILRPIPPLAWIPLSIIWLGVGFKSVLFITTIGSFFPIVVAMIAGVRNVDRRMIEFARTLGADTNQLLFKVIIPAALPQAFVGMRIAIGFSWMVVVAAEMISVKWGLGWMIWKARFSFDTATVIAGMILIGILSVLMTLGMARLEKILFRWKENIVKG